MAEVRIADVYSPLTYGGLIQEAQIELNRFLRSGIMVNDGFIASRFAQGGTTSELTNYEPLATGTKNISTDDPADVSTANKISKQIQVARVQKNNDSWTAMNVAADLALQDPVAAITNRIGQYWATDDEKILIDSLVGVLNDNVTNDGGDMTLDIYDDIASPLAANLISASAVNAAKQTLGDHRMNLNTIIMHSVVYSRLVEKQLVDVDNTNPVFGVDFGTYLNMQVVVDDSLPVIAGTNSPKYVTILCGPGAVRFAPAPQKRPSALDWDETAGNGAGAETLFSRVSRVIHPLGFSCDGSGWAEPTGATSAELQLATSWDRVYERKNIPIAFLESNG